MVKKKNESRDNAPKELSDVQREIELFDEATLLSLSGIGNEYLRLAGEMLGVRIGGRGRTLYLKGKKDDVDFAFRVFEKLNRIASSGREFTKNDIIKAIDAFKLSASSNIEDLYSDVVFKTKAGKQILAKSLGQREYVKSIQNHDVCFGVGPAGVGKTFLAMACAVSDLLSERVSRIILTRPAVEAGEHLGFLPGNFEEKVLPYLRPLYDALFELLGNERVEAMVHNNVIEIAPLAFMRGRTLNDAFIILDEAQNTTPEQMKMFLTRLGFGSKMVITGDVTQIDLPANRASGLIHSIEVLKEVNGVSIHWLNEHDVVRHGLVQSIVRAYDRVEKRTKNG